LGGGEDQKGEKRARPVDEIVSARKKASGKGVECLNGGHGRKRAFDEESVKTVYS